MLATPLWKRFSRSEHCNDRYIWFLFSQGVGNTLKRHYETYLLEYELAHDDVDGECCLLCHRLVWLVILLLQHWILFNVFLHWDWKLAYSSAAGDWVNCGICGEWAHFGCDRRQGLGAFKVLFLSTHCDCETNSLAVQKYKCRVPLLWNFCYELAGLCKNRWAGIHLSTLQY